MPRKVQRKQDIFQRTRKTWVENSEICKAPATTGASFNKSKARRENGPFSDSVQMIGHSGPQKNSEM
jgi:hypothetical protein